MSISGGGLRVECYCGNGYFVHSPKGHVSWSPSFHSIACFEKYIVERRQAYLPESLIPNRARELEFADSERIWDTETVRWYRSKYEVAVARFLYSIGEPFQYESVFFRTWGQAIYIPDFWLVRARTFVEVKGRWSRRGRDKLQAVQDRGYSIVVLGPETYSEFMRRFWREGPDSGVCR